MTGWYVHHFYFDDLAFFDDEMVGYLWESYKMGSGPAR